MSRKAKKTIFIEVGIKRLYAFEEGSINGWSPEKVIEDWFKNTPLGYSHASRDGHHVGNSDYVTSIRVLSEEEEAKTHHPRWEKYQKAIASRRKIAKVRQYKEDAKYFSNIMASLPDQKVELKPFTGGCR